MNLDWPLAFVIMVCLGAAAGVVSEFIKSRSRSALDEAEAKYAEQYRLLAAGYETLVKETRDNQSAIAADLSDLQKKVEGIEKILREVG